MTDLTENLAASAPAPVNPWEDRYDVIIESAGEHFEDNDVFLQVNGRSALVQRGVAVPLSAPFVEVLKNAIRTKMVKTGVDPLTGRDIRIAKNFPRHNFRVLGPHAPDADTLNA